MQFSQGDIVIINFPFSDLSQTKPRPCVVVSGAAANQQGDIILAAITSNNRADRFSFTLRRNLLTQPLHRDPCEVRCNKLFTASRSIVLKKVSSLKSPSKAALLQKIGEVFQ
jgi:mRNA interferase MazF